MTRARHAMTLIEVVVTLVAVGVLLAAASFTLTDLGDRADQRNATAELTAVQAAGRALASTAGSTFPADLTDRLTTGTLTATGDPSTDPTVISVARTAPTVAIYAAVSAGGCLAVVDDLTTGPRWLIDPTLTSAPCSAALLATVAADLPPGTVDWRNPTVIDLDTADPAPATDVTATAGDAGITLTWAPSPGPNLAGYRIVRATTGSAATELAVLEPDTLTYLDATVPPGTRATYAIEARGPEQNTGAAATVTVTTRPGVPLVTVTDDGTRAELTWTGAGPDVTNYTITVDGTTAATTAATTWIHSAAGPVPYRPATQFTYTVTGRVGTSDGPAGSTTVRTAPAAPGGLTATAQPAAVQLTWDPVPDATGYRIHRDGHVIADTVTADHLDAGLTNGVTYRYTVTATAAGTESGPSNETAATPTNPPGAPTNVTVTAGDRTLTATWPAVANATHYTATFDGTPICTTPATVCVATGLTNGHRYTIVVTATVAGIDGPPTGATYATPAPPPGPPTAVTATPADAGTAEITWAAPAATGGLPVTSATATATATGQATRTCTTTTTSCRIDALTGGHTYEVTVTVTTAAGTSPASTPATVTPTGPPAAPVSVDVVSLPTALTVTWTPVASPGSGPVTGYTATATSVGQATRTCTATRTSCTIGRLTDGVTYDVTVTGTNQHGTSPASHATPGIPGGGTSTVSGAVLVDRPVSYWPLDEPEGATAADLGTRNVPLTYRDTATAGATGILTSDPTRPAGRFTDGYATTGPLPAVAGDGVTAEAWLRPEPGTWSTKAWYTILANRAYVPGDGTYGFVIYVCGTACAIPERGTLQVWWAQGAGGGWNALTGPAVATDRTTHIAVTIDDAGFARLYVDGAETAARPGAGQYRPARTIDPVTVAANETGSARLNARVAAVAVYDHTLSAARIAAHAAA